MDNGRSKTMLHTAALAGLLMSALVPLSASAAVLFSDDFEDGNLSPWTVVLGDSGDAGVNDDTSQSGSQSMFLRFDQVAVASPVIDTSGSNATLELWIRKGDDDFSNYPENGEDLWVYYLDDNGDFTLLDTFEGGGTEGEIFTPSYNLPADARHPDFRVALLLTDSNGFDYWHIDDVTVSQSDPPFIGTGTGLTGAYCNRDGDYEDPCTSNPDVTRIDPVIEFASGDSGWPPSGIDDDTFSVRWTGEIQAQFTEDYTFHALHDDGVRIWVDGVQVIDNYVDQDDSWTDSGTPLSLERGERYEIVIEYYENGGDQDMTLAWSSASTAFRTTVPQSQLYPDASGSAPDADLLLDYRMEQNSWDGTTGEVTDSSGNDFNGTSRNGAQTDDADPAIAGDPGTCGYATLDGNNDYIEDADAGNYLEGLTAVTITAWVRNDSTGNDQGIFATVAPQNDDNRLGLRYDSDGFFGGGNNVIKASISTTDGTHQVETDSGLQSDQWHHLALVWEAGETLRVVVDGTTVGLTHADAAVGGAINNIDGLFVGRGVKSGDPYWQGEIDEFRIYEGALSDSEVATVGAETHPCAPAQALCAADFAVYTENGLNIGNGVEVNGNAVTGSGNAIEPDTGDRTDADLPLPGFDPASFPGFGGSQEQVPPDGPTFPADDYDRIQINNNRSVNLDTSNGNDFRINELNAGNRVTVNLDPGRYFIDSLNLGNDSVLAVTSGPVELYIGSALTGNDGAALNPGGSADDLIVRMHDGAQVQMGNDTVVVGTIYAPGSGTQIQASDRASITGGILTGGSVQLGNDVVLTYGTAAESAGRELAQCDAGGIDHYAISHSGTGVTCGAEPVTITAHDTGDNPVDPGSATIDLTTSTGEGTWAGVLGGSGTLSDGTAGDGAASYTFPDNGETAVTLAFNYTTVTQATDPETINFDVNGGNEGAGEDPDLVVSLSGLRITDGNGNPTTIPEQIAGKPSDTAPGAITLALQSIRASGSDPAVCEPYFDDGDDVEVELAGECNDPATCAGNALEVTNNGNTTAVATSNDDGGNGAAAYTPVTLRFGPNAEAPLVLAYDDAGQIQLHARHNPIDDGSGTPPVVNYVAGSSNPWVTRPFGFEVDVPADDGTTGAGGTILAVAGDDFDTTVRAVVWQAGDDGDDDGQPDAGADLSDNAVTPNFGNEASAESVILAPAVAAPAGGSAGVLSDAVFDSFSAGSETHGVSWNEAGHVHLDAAITDGSYLGGGDVTGRADTVGRFIPADFHVAVAANGDLDAACNATFTYTGQPGGYATNGEPVFTITARNRIGATTQNYRDAYARLSAGGVSVSGPAQDRDETGLEGDPVAVTTNLDTPSLVANDDGTLTYTLGSGDTFTYDKVNNARIDPITPELDIDVTGVDDGEVAADPGVLPATAQPSAVHQIRFGRLAIDAASGSELAPIGQPVRAEYWNSGTWQTHVADDCTSFNLTDGVDLRNPDTAGNTWQTGDTTMTVGGGTSDASLPTDPVTLAAGGTTIAFSAPGENNTGFIDVRLPLDAAAVGLDYLRGDWDDDDGAGDGPFDDYPAARATFGIYSGNPNWIHLRRTQ